MNLRIALSGKMASGKSTLADYLKEQYGFVEMSFAAKLKEICADLFPTTLKKDRKMLQQVGEHLRAVDSDVWVRYVYNRIPQDKSVVIADVRYPNEIAMLKKAGFTLIRINIDPKSQRKRVKELYGDIPEDLYLHVSETILDDYKGFDYTIDGTMSPAELKKAIDKILRWWSHD